MNACQDGFLVDDSLTDAVAKDLAKFNTVLSRLRARRVEAISISGPLLRSKIAWKIATYQQPVLYRVVMLAAGCASNWNDRNVLCACLAARALMETVALLLEFDGQLQALMEQKNLGGIDGLLTNKAFATKSQKLIDELPNVQAKSILTTLQNMDKRLLPGLWEHYCFLSERCHPNNLGHYQLFGVRNRQTNVITYSDYNHIEMHLDYVLAGAMLIEFVEPCMDRLDAAILQVSELHHGVAPLAENWE
jgi:hypothetical protein